MPEGISCSQRRGSLAKEGDRRAAKNECVVTAGWNKPHPTSLSQPPVLMYFYIHGYLDDFKASVLLVIMGKWIESIANKLNYLCRRQ